MKLDVETKDNEELVVRLGESSVCIRPEDDIIVVIFKGESNVVRLDMNGLAYNTFSVRPKHGDEPELVLEGEPKMLREAALSDDELDYLSHVKEE